PDERERLPAAHADAVLDHQVGDLAAVEEDEAIGRAARELPRILREPRRRDEDALCRSSAGERPEEGLDRLPGDGVVFRIALRLHVDLLEAEAVERDDAVDASIA